MQQKSLYNVRLAKYKTWPNGLREKRCQAWVLIYWQYSAKPALC